MLPEKRAGRTTDLTGQFQYMRLISLVVSCPGVWFFIWFDVELAAIEKLGSIIRGKPSVWPLADAHPSPYRNQVKPLFSVV